MEPLSICINTQTPLVQFLDGNNGSAPSWDPKAVVDLTQLREGVDFRYSPGGVTRMVFPLVRRLLKEGFLGEAHWVSLNPRAPPTMRYGALTLHNVAIDPERMAGYGKVKEAIWSRAHELGPAETHDELFWSEAFSEYAYYNRITAELIRRLDDANDFDVFYVHDFQQMAVGQMLGTLKPRIFRWHIPFDVNAIPELWRPLLKTYLDSYDVIVVSTRRYAESLAAFALRGRVLPMYPYIDPSDYARPNGHQALAVGERLGLGRDDTVALLVARMDPMKGQDLAIDAVAHLAPKYPALKLVLVGNGSFSGSKGGVGLSKSTEWRTTLEAKVKAAGLEGRVIFTGHTSQADLDALYERSQFTLLPSIREGFGLVAAESWVHDRPAIVTSRAGVAEMIEDGTSALVFDPTVDGALAAAMERLLASDGGPLRTRLIQGGRRALQNCSLDGAVTAERDMIAEATEA